MQKALAGNIFSLGICGLLVVALSNYFGRLPIIFLFQSFALVTCAWAAAATSLTSFTAARILNGLVASAAQSGALMWIKDLFFFHEHPRKINYVEFPIILSPYLGPLITAFIEYKVSWRWGFWVCTVLWGIGWLLIAGLLDETYYDRAIPEEQQAPRRSRWFRLIGVEQFKAARSAKRPLSVMLQPIMLITKLPLLLIVIYYFLNFAWVISVNTTISIWLVNFYAFNTKNLGETRIFSFPAQHCPSLNLSANKALRLFLFLRYHGRDARLAGRTLDARRLWLVLRQASRRPHPS